MKTFDFEIKGKVLVEDHITVKDAHTFLRACLDADNGAIAIDEISLFVKESKTKTNRRQVR